MMPMPNDRVKFWNSFVSRFGIFFVALIVFAILVSGYLVYTESASVISDYSKERIKHTSNLASQSFYAMLDEVSNDIAVISENPVLENFVLEPSGKNEIKLHQLFKVVLKNKASYFQIRLLDIADDGKEIVRYDKKDGEIVQIPETKLQYKGDRPYFQETLDTKRGEFYFSPINLNEEFGIVSLPHTPTLRAASLIFNEAGLAVNVLVINVDLSGFYARLNQLMQPDIKLYIADKNDQFLFAPDMDQCFGIQLKSGKSLTKYFNKSMLDISAEVSGTFDVMQDLKGMDYLYHVEGLGYFEERRKIYLLSLIEKNLVLQSAHNVRSKSIKIVFVVCLMALLFSFLFTRIFSKRISKITMAISNYGDRETPPEKQGLSEKRKDEIGVLARTFNNMRATIDQQMLDLKASLGKEQKAIRERDEFLQNMGHELRTPLSAILGLIQLLQKNNPSRQQQPIITSLTRSAKNLEGLMYDILDHQKLTEGKVHIKYSPCNLSELMQDIHAGYQFEAINKGLKFDMAIEGLGHEKYQTDPLRLNQIVTNLVVNAIKYTNKGEVKLLLRTNGEASSQFQVVVSDTGIGISANDLKKIKDRFYQASEEISGRYGGYGLGLSIVKQLTGLFGGTLDIQSKEGHGSSFTVTLPLIKADGPSQATDRPGDVGKWPKLQKRYTILHLEDDASGRLLVEQVLNDESFGLAQKSHPDEVLAYLDGQTPDLMISDLMIGHQQIEPTLRRIMDEHPMLPIVLVSAFDKDQMSEISPLFIQKPFDVNELLDKVYVELGKNEFDIPQLSSSYSQYDYDHVKMVKFLDILHEEFDQYLKRMEDAFQAKNQQEWEAILHKMVTHIKSMKLGQLSSFLPESIEELDEKALGQIKNSMLFCLCFFRVEQSVNSTI